jgi:putative ABC transport system permease protein
MLKNYIKIALKVLLRRKFFTFVSLFGIVFTLLVLMVSVALLDNLVNPGEPGSRFERSLMCERIKLFHERYRIFSSPSYYFLDRYLRPMQSAEKVSIHSGAGETVSYVEGAKLELQVKHTDAAFWYVMEFDFIEGGPFDENAVASAEHVAVINDKTARQVFLDEPAVGKYIETTDGNFRVVGVIPHRQVPTQPAYADVYIPVSLDRYAMTSQKLYSRYMSFVVVPEGTDPDQVKEEYHRRLDQAREDFIGDFERIECMLGTLKDLAIAHFTDSSSSDPDSGGGIMAYGSVIGLMVLFMLFPAINLVNINASRIIERSSEVGVRRAFGASRRTLVGQFLV